MAPTVTGISPRDGTPGTKVIIRGENLGNSKSDVIGVFICNEDCTLTAEWASASKIVCRTGKGLGKGSVIVTTKSGGRGTCTVVFTGLPPKKVGPLEESAVWVDETEYVDQRLDRNQKPTALSLRSDPLGLNSDDAVTKPPPNMNLSEMYPHGSPDPTDENFMPAWFLIERHFTTSFKQLKDGHTYMRRRAKNTNNAPLNHVKDSLPVFFEVQEMLSTIHQKMLRDEAGRNNENITANLEMHLDDASTKAKGLFTTVLNCKDNADSIRNTLGVLQRFKFLFYLPLNIEKNIKKGDYGVVINDYEKAKSLFSDTDVNVFKRVYHEVETRITDFRAKLRSELVQLPSPLYQQKRLIRYLLELNEEGDPAWDCLNNQHEWVQNQMIQCKNKFLAKAMKAADERKIEILSNVPQEFLEELSQLALSQIPEHWHLWTHYSTGVILSETGEKTNAVERLKEAAAKHSKQMKGLLIDTIILFVNLLRAAFLPATLDVNESDEDDMNERISYGIWPNVHIPAYNLLESVRGIRSVLSMLSNSKMADGALQSLNDLIHDMRVLCLSSFMEEARDAIASLKDDEIWEVNRSGITTLPVAFDSLMRELLTTLQDVLISQPGEEGIFARVAVQNCVGELANALFLMYTSSLETLAFSEEDVDRITHDMAVLSKPPLEKRLIIVLSNLRHTRIRILEHIFEKFNQLGFPRLEQTKEITVHAFADLDERIFEAYVERRIEPLGASLESGMYAGYFKWNECLRPRGVRSYVKSALTGIITIHAEVFTICPLLVKRVLQATICSLSEEMLRLVQCVQKFSANGSLQARLDLLALQQSTVLYSTEKSEKTFEEACNILPSLISGAEKKFLQDLLNRFKSGMMFHLKCLEVPVVEEH